MHSLTQHTKSERRIVRVIVLCDELYGAYGINEFLSATRPHYTQSAFSRLQVCALLLLLLLLLPLLLCALAGFLVLGLVYLFLCLDFANFFVEVFVVVRVLLFSPARHPVEHHKPLPASDGHDLVQVFRKKDGKRAGLALKLVDELWPRACAKVPACVHAHERKI